MHTTVPATTMTRRSKSTNKREEMVTLKAISSYLTARGLMVLRINSGAMLSEYKGKRYMYRGAPPGTADLLCVVPPLGKLLAIEVKTKKGKLRDSQKEFLDRVAATGGMATVARSVDDAKAILDEYERRHGRIGTGSDRGSGDPPGHGQAEAAAAG